MRELGEGARALVGVIGTREEAEVLSGAVPYVTWVWLGSEVSVLGPGVEVDGLVCCTSRGGSGEWSEEKQAALEMPVLVVHAAAKPCRGRSSFARRRADGSSRGAGEAQYIGGGRRLPARSRGESLVQVVTEWLEREAETLEGRATDRMLARVARAFIGTRWKADGGEPK